MYREIENLDEAALNRLCFERGIPISILNREKKLSEFKKWHTLSNLRNVSDSLLLFSRVIRFTNVSPTEDLKLDEYQILKRCPNEIYYYEKHKVFEETLALDELKSLLAIISLKYEKDGTDFSAGDLDNYAQLLGKLRTRFNEFNNEIEDTFRIGSEIDEYIENTIIIHYLMEWKLKDFEKEHPSLVEKAKEIFGNEFYYSIPDNKEKLKSDQKMFNKIEERKNEIEFQLNELLKIAPPKAAEANV